MRSRKPPLRPAESERNRLKGSPPTEDRAARLAALKLAVDDGTYEISADDVAEKVIARLRNTFVKS